jgi:hypothetical protein
MVFIIARDFSGPGQKVAVVQLHPGFLPSHSTDQMRLISKPAATRMWGIHPGQRAFHKRRSDESKILHKHDA